MADQSNEMVSRVAAAMEAQIRAYAARSYGEVAPHARGTLSVDSEVDMEELARAAIEAMRPPTEKMLVAGCNHDDPLGGLVDWRGNNVTTRETIGGVFTSMVDAALSHDEVKG